ncbi:DUF3846 domain-containing protein [Streptomyces flavofungini]|uniref:DUF3846 domain-containing protein n=1 Tax=Streptomyces flavofungini TaxID=68200 RepID=UPI0025AF7199|nr:DUF3846 domain-containing protein [Streptomyces flavofungini]WJV51719.1 DUF3846 domain-containing protein [Streptomyces flavofungini]
MFTTATATEDQSYALLIQPTGAFRLMTWSSATTPRHVLRCETARPVDLTTTLTLWVDEDAATLGEKANRAAHGLITLYRPTPPPYFGDVAVTGTPDASGNAPGLSETQALALISMYLETAPTSLMPHPRRS